MAEGYVKLNDGNLMPTFGLGVYQTAPGQSTYDIECILYYTHAAVFCFVLCFE